MSVYAKIPNFNMPKNCRECCEKNRNICIALHCDFLSGGNGNTERVAGCQLFEIDDEERREKP